MMKVIAELLSSHWASALGWTLLHSLWQAMVVLLAAGIALRFIPTIRSSLRYAVISASLFALSVISVWTFVRLLTSDETPGIVTAAVATSASPGFTYDAAAPDALSTTAVMIASYMPVLIGVWLIGFVISSLRFAAGILYTQRIKATATPLDNEWQDYIKITAKSLGISRAIQLAESAAISAPIVIGYLKPVVLIPVGMLTGLSGQQLETIFLHELAHIKRHDYLVNLVQSVVEVVFFFNPFVWILSGLMRREREYCCDDLVVRRHPGTKAYAHALAQLASNGRVTPGFALSLAGDKNQLLTRIKRIMEKTVKPYSVRGGKLIPALLLVAALLCISWLGIQRNTDETGQRTLPQDTIRPKEKNVARYSRKRIITTDENGRPHEEIVEEFEGDEDLRPLLEQGLPTGPGFAFPGIPQPGEGQHAQRDTFPLTPFHPEQWEAFSKAFEQHFEMNFPDLFALGDKDASAFFKEFEQRFNFNMPDSAFRYNEPPVFGGGNPLDSVTLQGLREQLKELQGMQLEHFKNFGNDFSFGPGPAPMAEKTLREHLMDDGYLSKGERIESLQWSDRSLKVNGKSIRKEDHEKYSALYDAFMNGTLADGAD